LNVLKKPFAVKTEDPIRIYLECRRDAFDELFRSVVAVTPEVLHVVFQQLVRQLENRDDGPYARGGRVLRERLTDAACAGLGWRPPVNEDGINSMRCPQVGTRANEPLFPDEEAVSPVSPKSRRPDSSRLGPSDLLGHTRGA
jgi:hypothetical protein